MGKKSATFPMGVLILPHYPVILFMMSVYICMVSYMCDLKPRVSLRKTFILYFLPRWGEEKKYY